MSPAPTWRQVGPLFAERCTVCHGGEDPTRGLDLGSLAGVKAGSRGGPVVDLDEPEESELVLRLRVESEPRMPLDGPPFLSDDEITLLERWVRGGARDSRGSPSPVPAGRKVRSRGRLTGIWQIDGLDVIVDRGTCIDDAPRIGQRAEVRGVVQPDGSIRATRLRDR